MNNVETFTCADCGTVGEQCRKGRKRLRCGPCGRRRSSELSSNRPWAERKAGRATAACEGCGRTYPKYRRTQRWCSQACGNRFKRKPAPGQGLSPEARERQRLSWQAKNRRRRAAKRGGASERYSLAEIAERDGWLCQLCGELVPADAKVPHLLAPTIDHVVALSRGGDDTKGNVQLAHFRCNSVKGPRPVLVVTPLGGVDGE